MVSKCRYQESIHISVPLCIVQYSSILVPMVDDFVYRVLLQNINFGVLLGGAYHSVYESVF